MTEELKCCPFCGTKPKIKKNIDDSFRISCENLSCVCLPDTWAYKTIEEAIAAWNRREGGQDNGLD